MFPTLNRESQMRQPTQMFVDAVRKAWGNPKKVAEAGLNETFRHEDAFSFDHDDQINNARDIGILAGQTAGKTPEVFIEDFTTLLNENDE